MSVWWMEKSENHPSQGISIGGFHLVFFHINLSGGQPQIYRQFMLYKSEQTIRR